jgi:hypothetical protein
MCVCVCVRVSPPKPFSFPTFPYPSPSLSFFLQNCQKFALCFCGFICEESLLLGFITSAKLFASLTRRMNTRTRRSSLFSFCLAFVSSNVGSFSSSSSCSQMLSLIPFCCCFHLSSLFTCSLLLSQVFASASPCSYDDTAAAEEQKQKQHRHKKRRRRRRSNRPQQQKDVHARKP